VLANGAFVPGFPCNRSIELNPVRTSMTWPGRRRITPARFTAAMPLGATDPILLKKGAQKTLSLLRGLKALEREGVLTPGEFNLKKWDLLAKRLPMER
jgi:hypothetical protein